MTPREEVGVEIDSDDDDGAANPKGRNQRRNRKRKEKVVFSIETSGDPSTGKKTKTEVPGKEAAKCVDCLEDATSEKTGQSEGPYCKIHCTKGYNLQECH